MKVFVAGATGVIGRRAVSELVAAGHSVTGVARSDEKAELLRDLGAEPVRVDLFDASGVARAVEGHDAVVNLATHIPPFRKMARTAAWSENERIRTRASRNLADATISAGASVYVQESIAFLNRDRGDEWIDEEPLAPSMHTDAVRAAEVAAQSVTDVGRRGVVLRFGRFLAPDSDQIQTFVKAATFGLFIEPGAGDVYLPTIHVDDAARAVVAALDAPAGIYHVVNDAQTRGEHRQALSRAVGRRLFSPPAWFAKLTGSTAVHLFRSQRTSNRRFREATGWEARYRDADATWGAIVDALGARRPALSGWLRTALWLLVASGLLIGVQALFAPHAFFRSFPFGRGWTLADGPYNEHLVRDFGALNLSFVALAGTALVARSRSVARATGLAWLVFSVPHLVYHLFHLDLYGTPDDVAQVASLALGVVLGAALLLLPAHAGGRAVDGTATVQPSDSPTTSATGSPGSPPASTPADRASTTA